MLDDMHDDITAVFNDVMVSEDSALDRTEAMRDALVSAKIGYLLLLREDARDANGELFCWSSQQRQGMKDRVREIEEALGHE